MKPYFDIDKFGELYIDTVIFESNYPILFTCVNDKKDLFLCVCCRYNKAGRKWLLTKTTPNIVIQLLKNELTIRGAFLKYPQVQITVLDDNQEVRFYENNTTDWDGETSTSLPDKDEFLDAEDGEFDDEIQHFESMLCDNYNAVFDKMKFNLSNEQIKQNMMSIDELVSVNLRLDTALIKGARIYNNVKQVLIKKESLSEIYKKYIDIYISYSDEYKEVKKKCTFEQPLPKNNKAYMEIEQSTGEISEAA